MKKEKKKSISTLIVFVILMAIGFFIAIVGIPKIGDWFNGGWTDKDRYAGNAKNIILGLELQGGASITYQVKGEDYSEQNVKDTIAKLQERVDAYSTEGSVYQEGDNRIVAEIPGVDNEDEIFKNLAEVGTIEFKTEDGKTVIDGNDIADAKATVDSSKAGSVADNIVSLTLTDSGKSKFAKATRENIGKPISIFYNNKKLQSPTVQTAIEDGRAQISGQKSPEEAEQLATYIRIGSLPIELEQLRSSTIAANLGSDALNTSLLAGGIGLLLVIIFMIIVYRVPGVVASLALAAYGVIEVILLNFLDITLTLPGIAGIILSIGMAVDANVIIFTRIKEEIGLGKPVKSAIEIGFHKALSAILDGNITTLIAAIVLGVKGSGTVKGFAYTLGLGIIVSMFSALFVTRKLLWAFFNIGCNKPSMYGKKINSDKKVIDFVGNKVKYFIISGVIIVAGIVAMIVSYVDSGDIFAYSLDFKGGTSITIDFDKNGSVPEIKEIETFFADEIGLKAVVAPEANTTRVNVKVDDLSNKMDLREKISKKLKEKYKVEEKDMQEESISATVSDEMKTNALVAVGLATVAMLLYIWFRFKKISFALGSVIPLIHDCFIVLSCYALTQITLGNTFIACMLTLVGYSINATIVIFDRIRESNVYGKSKEEKKQLVNTAITQTLTRSINTSLTTLISIVALYIVGVPDIKAFTLPLMVGIIAGAYSSVCIAGTIWFVIDKSNKKPTKADEQKKKIKESKDKILV